MDVLPGLRKGLADAITLNGFQVSPYTLNSPTPPAVHVFPDGTQYDHAGSRGTDLWTFIVQAFVGRASDVGSQILLDTLIEPKGDTSIKALVEADPTLGGVAEDLRVTSFSGYEIYAIENRSAVLGAKWTVEVLVPGT